MITTCIPSNYTIMYISVDRYPINYAFVHNPQPVGALNPHHDQSTLMRQLYSHVVYSWNPIWNPYEITNQTQFFTKTSPISQCSHGRNYTPTCITCLPLKLTIFAHHGVSILVQSSWKIMLSPATWSMAHDCQPIIAGQLWITAQLWNYRIIIPLLSHAIPLLSHCYPIIFSQDFPILSHPH